MFEVGEGETGSVPTAPVVKRVTGSGRRSRRVGAYKGDACKAMKWAVETSGVSVSELARRMSVERNSVKQYLNGKRTNPGVEFLSRWLSVCGFELEVVQR